MSGGRTALVALLLVACEHGSSPGEPPDASATAVAQTRAALARLAPEAIDERRALLDRGCGFDDAELCLRAASAHLGEPAERVLALAEKACRLDPHVFIASEGGVELSCQYFERDAVERAAKLATACDANQARACRDFADFLRPYDALRARRGYLSACERAGVEPADREGCARFRQGLAGPPTCPAARPGSAFTYLQCPSEAKRAPSVLAPVRVELTKSAHEAALRQALGQVTEDLSLCHTAAVLDDPTAGGKLGLRVLFDRLGGVARIESESGAAANPFELDCVVRQLAKLQLAEGGFAATIRLELQAPASRIAP